MMSGSPTDYHCKLPWENLTSAETIRLLPNKTDEEGKQVHDKCRMYDVNYTDPNVFDTIRNLSGIPTVPCMHGWHYDRSDWTSTVVTEWNLVCDKELYVTHAYTINGAGSLFSMFFMGFVADRFVLEV